VFSAILGSEHLYTSLDGASIYPPPEDTASTASGSRAHKTPDDWAHVDQTDPDLLCVQSQVVLSNSQAAFRCTPTSHARHREILEMCGIAPGDRSHWLKFNASQLPAVRALFESDLWQMPVHAPAGSVIFWRSSTIHSATSSMPIRPTIGRMADQWAHDARARSGDTRLTSFCDRSGRGAQDGWRCVVYISMRLVEEYDEADRQRLAGAARDGRTTNHWGTKIFKVPHRSVKKKVPQVQRFLNEPRLCAIDEAELSEVNRKLTALDTWE